MLSVGDYGRVSRCSQLVEWCLGESQELLSIGDYGRVSRCSRLVIMGESVGALSW